jgi:hypothetical protein
MSGEMSPDRNYYWDGQGWKPAASPDGAWRWDGAAWRPSGAPAPAPRSRQAPWMIALAAVATLLVGGVGIWMMAGFIYTRSHALQAPDFSISCAGTNAHAGAALSTGDVLCGQRLGAAYYQGDCTRTGGMPSGAGAWQTSGSSSTFQPTTLAGDSTGCTMEARPAQQIEVSTSDTQPPSTVAVVDFVPLNRSGGEGVQVACTTDASCIDCSIYQDGSYSLDQGIPNGKFDNLTQGDASLFGGQPKVGVANRMVLRLSGTEVTVFMNGNEVTSATTTRAQGPGYVTFYVDDGGSTTTETVKLQRILVFEAIIP